MQYKWEMTENVDEKTPRRLGTRRLFGSSPWSSWYFSFIYRQLEVEGKVAEAAMSYMDALELMDSDYSVHVKVMELAEQMNFQPALIETA